MSVSLRLEPQETIGNVASAPSPIVAAGGMGRQVNIVCRLMIMTIKILMMMIFLQPMFA